MHRLILFFQEEYMSIVQQQQKAAQEIQCWTFQLKLWWQIDVGISIKSKSHEILYKRSLVFESIADTVVVWSSSSCLQQILNIAPSVVILAPFSNLTAALTAKAIKILDKARYEAEYCFFENLVNMVNVENVENVVNVIKAQEEEMICVRDVWI